MKTLNSKTGNGMTAVAALLILMASFSTISKGENPGTEAIENESELIVESWMTDNSFWYGLVENEKAEPAMRIESWMNSSSYWGESNIAEEIETLPALAIENWMADNTYWNGRPENEEAEPAIVIESWMMSSAYWNGSTDATAVTESSLPVESWMNNSAYWTGTNVQINSTSQMANI